MIRHTLSSSEDPTLYLPRILCLHGGGTNARIFRAQCRVLEKRLKPFFRFCYVQAPFLSEAGSDVISVYKKYGPFRAWIDPEQDCECITESVERALYTAMAEDDSRGATGEFVGLLGFSQGARTCGSLLLAQQMREAHGIPNFLPVWKFAILLAGRGPLMLRTSEIDYSGMTRASSPEETPPPTPPAGLLDFPSIHVHGLKDPGLDLHRQFLHENFDRRRTRVIEWDGEHRIPIKTNDVDAIVKEILPMARRAGILHVHAGP